MLLKVIICDINYLKSKPRSFSFGNIKDRFEYTGPYLKRDRIGKNGFFYEFERNGVFNIGTHPDLHLSIFDISGIAVPHITFKPDGPGGIEFHYGIISPKNNMFKFWITKSNLNKAYNINLIKHTLIEVFYQSIGYIKVYRISNEGRLIRSPYTINPYGTLGRDPTTEQKKLSEERKKITNPYIKRGLFLS